MDVFDEFVILLIVQLVEGGVVERFHFLVEIPIVEELVLAIGGHESLVDEVEAMGYLLIIQIVIGVQDVVHAVFNSPIIQSDILQVHEVQLKDHQVLWVVSPHLGEVCLILHDPDHHIEHFEALVDLLHKGSLHQTLGVLLAAGVVELVVDVEFNEVGVVLFGHVGANPVFDILAFCFLVVLELRHQQLLLKIRRKKLRDQSMDDDVAFELKDPALGGYS